MFVNLNETKLKNKREIHKNILAKNKVKNNKNKKRMVSVYIVGGSGYTGGELLRILLNHSEIENIKISSRTYKGKDISELHPNLTDTGISFENYNLKRANKADFVFVCTPHGKAMEIVKDLTTRVIDLSADYRIKDIKAYEFVYKVKHNSPDLVKEAVYGLPELHRDEIADARVVANPGCLATGAILAAYPLLKDFGEAVQTILFDSKTGVSGAGKNPSERVHFCRVNEDILPYKLTNHRHILEMKQELGTEVFFTPHMLPVSRGILTSTHVLLSKDIDIDSIKEAYSDFYHDEPFVRVLEGVPSLNAVRGSNYCHIGGFEKSGGRLVLFSTIDNLVKGASGVAVQNMNIMADFDETEGLKGFGIQP